MGSTLLIFALAIIGSDDSSTKLQQRVDLIELNHFFDEHGRHVFDQVIFYEWSKKHHRFHVKAWRLVKDKRQLPEQTWKPAGYRCVWHDDGFLRTVAAPAFRETWSQVDPERTNRKLLAQDQRSGLAKPLKLKKQPTEAKIAAVAQTAELR